jgi:hypothetical protein
VVCVGRIGASLMRGVRRPMEFVRPHQLLTTTERRMESVGDLELFNDPAHQKLRESWCAGLFGTGLELLSTPCLVATNDSRDEMDVDFFVRVGQTDHRFQVTEAQEPGRRRGLEYRQRAAGNGDNNSLYARARSVRSSRLD